MMRKQRGVSHLIATVALIVVTLAAMFVYVQGLNQYATGETGLLSGTFRVNSMKNYERVSIVTLYKNSTGLYIYAYNYGELNATVSRLIINSNPVANGSYAPINLPAKSLSMIAVSPASYTGQIQISIITGRGNVIFQTGVV
jgi:hypothetical protein